MINRIQQLRVEAIVLDSPVYSLAEQFAVPARVSRGSVLHSLHYNVPVFHRGPLLVTIHDLTHILDESYRHGWRSRIYARPMLRSAARRADRVFAVSEYVKNCIVEHLKVPAEKITIVWNGVGPEFSPGSREAALKTVGQSMGSKSPYLLFVGNLKPHKNAGNLLRAFAQLADRPDFDYRLIVVGDDRRGRIVVGQLVESLRLTGRVQIIPKLPQSDLVEFYRAADLLVLPSFEEGFGLPILEAMACGTPVVCSSSASLPEVGGDAASYFDPHSPEEMAHRIITVLDSVETRQRMSRSGIRRAAQFTWERSFHSHFNVYREFLPQAAVAVSRAS